MALIDLFTRRPAAPAAPAEDPVPRVWPEIGETWKPEGLPVAERYYNQAHAVVLVASTGRTPYYLVACLGCHFLSTRTKSHDSHILYTLTTAAGAANDRPRSNSAPSGSSRRRSRAPPAGTAEPDHPTPFGRLTAHHITVPLRHSAEGAPHPTTTAPATCPALTPWTTQGVRTGQAARSPRPRHNPCRPPYEPTRPRPAPPVHPEPSL
ncbi:MULTISPECIES: hypothetical protein [Streptomyces]|uniref:hypothetical protein n=1 Tax=Streptomyces TaxID=1883 RepID=UPI0002419BF2|nr:hypothetical protein [Streptomyces sp. W007]EHM31509.1 hypothetical protein SPW_0089 [Streptomyces sp. W007]WTD15289.1 hypothetical protein OHA54_39130 [Streptomyces anulatus]WTE08659.1 hypothetical protein OH765_39605 [Streptomyces anulatus]